MKKKQFYLSETSGGVKILDKNTSFSDIHRGIIFKDLDSINQYMNGIYNTFLDKCYYPDLFSSIIKEELEPLKFKYFKYKNRIDRFSFSLFFTNILINLKRKLEKTKLFNYKNIEKKISYILDEAKKKNKAMPNIAYTPDCGFHLIFWKKKEIFPLRKTSDDIFLEEEKILKEVKQC